MEPLEESLTEPDRTLSGLTRTIDLVSGFITRRVLDYPGFVEWRRSRINKVLSSTGFGADPAAETIGDFTFDAEFLRHYEAIHSWLRLHTTSEAAKDCEFYFRRYPFRGLPVTREAHLRYVCEMWFSRIYEYKERLKACLNGLNAVLPGPKLEAGTIIKAFARDFDTELRERNQVHHHRQFQDAALEKVGLTYMMSLPIGDTGRDLIRAGWRMEHDAAYRDAQREWANRARNRGRQLEVYTAAIGDFMVDNMSWLTEPDRGPR